MGGSTRGQHGPRGGAGVDAAVQQARRVVGLYGDPDVSWSVLLVLRLSRPTTVEAVSTAAGNLVDAHPHLGPAPRVEGFGPGAEPGVLAALANEPFGDAGPLLRVAVGAGGRTLVLAAHHGAVDGLGMLGVATALLAVPLTSTARGIAREAEPTSFVRGSLRRLGEAAFAPPVRLDGDRAEGSALPGDWLEARDVDVARPGSAALVRAAADLVRRTNGPDRRGKRLVVSMGLSRRPGRPVPDPDRDTAYMRLRIGNLSSTADARRLIAATAPEPAFPVGDAGGLGPAVARRLSHRLGATVLVSNLGLVDNPSIESVRFWPVPTGPAGVCLGLASTPATTTLTFRARRGWFSEQAARRLADVAADCLASAGAEDADDQ